MPWSFNWDPFNYHIKCVTGIHILSTLLSWRGWTQCVFAEVGLKLSLNFFLNGTHNCQRTCSGLTEQPQGQCRRQDLIEIETVYLIVWNISYIRVKRGRVGMKENKKGHQPEIKVADWWQVISSSELNVTMIDWTWLCISHMKLKQVMQTRHMTIKLCQKFTGLTGSFYSLRQGKCIVGRDWLWSRVSC